MELLKGLYEHLFLAAKLTFSKTCLQYFCLQSCVVGYAASSILKICFIFIILVYDILRLTTAKSKNDDLSRIVQKI